jgi:hypothetical protein
LPHSASAARVIDFKHRHKCFQIRLPESGELELYVNGCLRKRRERGERAPQYVWTNLELEWEEHHYIEARYWAAEQRLAVTINGEPIFDQVLSPP